MYKTLIYFLLLNINFMSGLFCHSLEKYQISNLQTVNNIIPVIVIGGGVAGIAAALCLVQEGVSCVLIGGPKPGGSLIQSQLVRNWPGKMGMSGMKIVSEMWEHAHKMRIPIFDKEEVVSVDFSLWPYRVTTKNFENGKENEYRTLSCIVATGAEINKLNVVGEEQYWGKGVSFCVWCDGPLYHGSKIIVVGGGHSAVFKAGFMADIAQEVLLVVRKDRLSVSDDEEINQLYQRKNVRILFNTEVKEFKGDKDSLTSVILKNNKTSNQWEENIDGVFLSIGWQANTSIFNKQLDLNSQGAIILRNDQGTSIMGVFAAGEVCQLRYLQAIVAAGQGCVAALQSKDFLQKIGVFEQKNGVFKEKVKSWWQTNVLESPIPEIQSISDFESSVLEEKLPVIVNFYSPWCSLCKNMLPILEECAEFFDGKIKFAKVNIGGGSVIPNDLVKKIGGKNIRGVPCVLFVKNGEEIARFQGACSHEEFFLKLKEIFSI